MFKPIGVNNKNGAGFSRCRLVAFGCCLLFGQVVVSLTYFPFPFSILVQLCAKTSTHKIPWIKLD